MLRGYDPEQVRSAMDEMHTSVVTARRLAADRTIELTKMQEHLNRVQRDLGEAAARIAELQGRQAQAAPTAGEVGARIGSILALADEEAEELRAAGREQARRQLDDADAAIAASRAEVTRYADEARHSAHDDANRIVEEARHQASDLLDEAERDAQARRTEAEAIVESHRAQTAAVTQFGGEIAKHAERLHLAQARVEQLAHDEASLVEHQAQENTDRIQRDKENQLAAVDARRDSITAQLTTLGALLREVGQAVSPSPDDADGSDSEGPVLDTEDQAGHSDDPAPSDVVEVWEHADDHPHDAAAPADEEDSATAPLVEAAGSQPPEPEPAREKTPAARR
ncbi:MAG: hypothetical protein ABJA74_08730 [Lapillicoccus sp.]